jgi:hypothetical protein
MEPILIRLAKMGNFWHCLSLPIFQLTYRTEFSSGRTHGSALLLGGPTAVAVDPLPASPSPTIEENSLGQEILSKERAELDALKAGDFNAFGNLIAHEAVFVDALGPSSKDKSVTVRQSFQAR